MSGKVVARTECLSRMTASIELSQYAATLDLFSYLLVSTNRCHEFASDRPSYRMYVYTGTGRVVGNLLRQILSNYGQRQLRYDKHDVMYVIWYQDFLSPHARLRSNGVVSTFFLLTASIIQPISILEIGCLLR